MSGQPLALEPSEPLSPTQRVATLLTYPHPLYKIGCVDRGEGYTLRVRKAVSVDADLKRQNLNRLRRIEGQVRGLQQMVEGDRYCGDILVQIASVQEALRGVGRALLKNHLRHCVTNAVVNGRGEADAMYEELVQLFDRHGK
jgi:CsoR family transcriptional regulator, copper-sensing transcriptional repressor